MDVVMNIIDMHRWHLENMLSQPSHERNGNQLAEYNGDLLVMDSVVILQ